MRTVQDTIVPTCMKHTNIRIVRIPKGEKIKKGKENLVEELMVENFPNVVNETESSPEITECSKEDEPKEPTPGQIIVIMIKVRENLKKNTHTKKTTQQ